MKKIDEAFLLKLTAVFTEHIRSGAIVGHTIDPTVNAALDFACAVVTGLTMGLLSEYDLKSGVGMSDVVEETARAFKSKLARNFELAAS